MAVRCWSSTATRSPSARSTRPASGASSPVRRRISVDLPLPFGPSRPSRVPGPSTRLTSSRMRPLAEALGDVLGDDEPPRAPLGGAEVDRPRCADPCRSSTLASSSARRAGLVDARLRLASCAPSGRGAATRPRAARGWRASPASAPARAARRPCARGTRCSARASRRSRRRAPDRGRACARRRARGTSGRG